MKNLMDMHVHTHHSPDGADPAARLCEAALSRSLRAVALTDHCECDAYFRDGYDRSVRQSYAEALEARAAFGGRLTVCAGIELGQPLSDAAAARDALSAGPYDFVLCSLHNLADGTDFYRVDYRDPVCDAGGLMRRYFRELGETARLADFDSLAHIYYPLRYIPGDVVSPDELIGQNRAQIDDILRALAERGRALELNLSALRRAKALPARDVDALRRFRGFGGRRVTLGTDAHRASAVGAHLGEGMRAAQAAGFREVTMYVAREPVPVAIE